MGEEGEEAMSVEEPTSNQGPVYEEGLSCQNKKTSLNQEPKPAEEISKSSGDKSTSKTSTNPVCPSQLSVPLNSYLDAIKAQSTSLASKPIRPNIAASEPFRRFTMERQDYILAHIFPVEYRQIPLQ